VKEEMNEEVYCICDDWKKSMPQVIEAQRMIFVRHGVRYTGSKMRFCPWCRGALFGAKTSDNPKRMVVPKAGRSEG